MPWNKELREMLYDALLAAFDRQSLRRTVSIRMDQKLDSIASGSDFRDIVFSLIEWAEQQGKIPELIRAALTDGGDNLKLKEFADRYYNFPEPNPESTVAALQSLIRYVRQEANMVARLTGTQEVHVNSESTLHEVLSRRTFFITPSQARAIQQIQAKDLISVIVHDFWSSHGIPQFHFDKKAVTVNDIAKAIQIEFDED